MGDKFITRGSRLPAQWLPWATSDLGTRLISLLTFAEVGGTIIVPTILANNGDGAAVYVPSRELALNRQLNVSIEAFPIFPHVTGKEHGKIKRKN